MSQTRPRRANNIEAAGDYSNHERRVAREARLKQGRAVRQLTDIVRRQNVVIGTLPPGSSSRIWVRITLDIVVIMVQNQ